MEKNVLISTGDFSGDTIAEKIVPELNKKGNYKFYGIVGKGMKDIGMEIIRSRIKTGATGITEILPKIFQEWKLFNIIQDFIKKRKINAAILFDNPGFNLPLAKFLYNKGIKVFYFSPPQVWAWGEWRIKYLRNYVYLNFVTLPFEEKYYKSRGVNAIFVGHLATLLSSQQKEDTLIFLPGSRETEIQQTIPYAGPSIEEWADKNHLRVIVPLPTVLQAERWINFGRKYLHNTEFLTGKSREILPEAKIGVICSGTSTLEAVFSLTPAVVIYRLSPMSYFIGKSLLKTEYISLANIISKKEVQKEVVQYQLKPEIIREALDYTWDNQAKIIMEYNIIQTQFRKEKVDEKTTEILSSLI